MFASTPLTITVEVPVGVETLVDTLSVDEPEAPLTELVLNAACMVEGTPLALRFTVPVKPF